jgi:CubicO group peptidase (beta-lactamase class C family)
LTCAAVMQLWEGKKFALDDAIDGHLPFLVRNPSFPEVRITFRQLLTHTSSIASGPAYGNSYACGDSRTPLGRWLREYLSPGGSIFDEHRNFHPWAPGTRFQYSNVAYGLLGYLVETVSDIAYPDYMRKQIFAPLGMLQSRFSLEGMDPQSHATAYTLVKDGDFAGLKVRDPAWVPPAESSGGVQVPHCLYSFATPPDGLARTSAEELSRFLQAFMNAGALDGHSVLQPETIAQILSDQHVPFDPTDAAPPTFRQGLAWRRFDDPVLGTLWGHTGGDPGVSTLMSFRPKDRRGVIVLTNSSEGHRTGNEIARRIYADSEPGLT